jgi:mannosyltransferase
MDVKAKSNKTWHIVPLLLLLLLLLAWGLRLLCLGCQNLWYDEAFTLAVARADWDTFWQALLSDAVHPPAYYLLLRGWVHIVGDPVDCAGLRSEFGLRFMSVLSGTLAVGVMWRLGAALGGRRLAAAAALLLALNPFALWYAQEARMYSLLLLLTLGSGWTFWRMLTHLNWRRWLSFVLVTAAAFLVHYFAFLLSLAQFAYLVLRLRRRQRAFRWWALAQAVAILPFLPWAWAVATREGRNFGIGWIPATGLIDIPLTLANLSMALSQPASFWTWAGLTLFVAAGLGGMWCHRRSPDAHRRQRAAPAFDGALYLTLWLLLPILFVWLLSQRLPIYVDRFFIVSLPPLLLLVGTVSLCPRRWARGIMILVLLVTTAAAARLWLDPNMVKERWQDAAELVAQQEQPGDVLVMRDFQTSIPFRVYYRGDLELQTVTTNRESIPMDSLAAGHKRLWLVYRQPFASSHQLAGSEPINWQDEVDPLIAEWMHKHNERLSLEKSFPGIYLLRFELTD